MKPACPPVQFSRLVSRVVRNVISVSLRTTESSRLLIPCPFSRVVRPLSLQSSSGLTWRSLTETVNMGVAGITVSSLARETERAMKLGIGLLGV